MTDDAMKVAMGLEPGQPWPERHVFLMEQGSAFYELMGALNAAGFDQVSHMVVHRVEVVRHNGRVPVADGAHAGGTKA